MGAISVSVLLAVMYALVLVCMGLVTLGMAASAARRPTAGAARWRRQILPVQVAVLVLAAVALAATVAGDGPARRPLAVVLVVVGLAALALAARALLGTRAGARPAPVDCAGPDGAEHCAICPVHTAGACPAAQSSSTVPPERQ